MSVITSQLPVADKADGTPGSTAPTSAIQVGGTDGTDLRVIKTDSSGNLLVSLKIDTTPGSPTAATAGVASAQVVAANANRKGLVLINTSNNRISIAFGVAAVLNSGITLYPGGTFVMDAFTFDLGAVNAIASAASSNLAIQEYS